MHSQFSSGHEPDLRPARALHRRLRGSHGSRGVAIILALLAVGTAVVLGMALASTSSASVLTGHSLTVTAAARSAAAGGLDLATALLADPARLGSDSDPGTGTVLFEGVKIGQATYRAEVADLSTLAGATVDSDAVAVIARAESSGVEQAIRSVGRLVRPDAYKRADLDLSEFAVLLTGASPIEWTGDSRIGTWAQSPYAALREPLLVGNSGGSPAVDPADHARISGWAQVAIGTPAATNDEEDEQLSEKRRNIASPVLVPEPPMPPAPTGGVPFVFPADGVVSASAVLTGEVTLGSPVQLNDGGGQPIVLDIEHDLIVATDVNVAGPTVIVVRSNLLVESGARIIIAPGASLSIVTLGDTQIYAETIQGAENSVPARTDGTEPYVAGGPRFSLYCHGSSVRATTVMFGEIYAPNASVKLAESVVYGRVVAAELNLDGSRLFYDPALNSQRGWTNPESAIWESNLPVAGMRLELGTLADLCDAHGVAVELPRLLAHAPLNTDSARDGEANLDRGRLEAERLLVRSRLLDGTYDVRRETDPRRMAHRFKLREPLQSN